MMKQIQFSGDQHEQLASDLQQWLANNTSADIGRFEAGFLLDHVSQLLGAYWYNQGVRDAQTLLDVQDAVLGLHHAAEDLEQRGLARPVAPDQADTLAALQGEVGVIQQRHVAEGQLRVRQGKKCHAAIMKGRCWQADGQAQLETWQQQTVKIFIRLFFAGKPWAILRPTLQHRQPLQGKAV